MSQLLSVLGKIIPEGVETPEAVANHLVETGAVAVNEGGHLSEAIAERFKIGKSDRIDRELHFYFGPADLKRYTKAHRSEELTKGLKSPETPGAGSGGPQRLSDALKRSGLSSKTDELSKHSEILQGPAGSRRPVRVRRDPVTTPGRVSNTRVAIEMEMASVKLTRGGNAEALFKAVADPARPEVSNRTLLQTVETTTVKDEQTKEEVTLPVFTVELETGQGGDTFFIEVSTGPLPYGDKGEGVESNRKIIECWLKACEEVGGATGKTASLGTLAAAFNRIATGKNLSMQLHVTAGGGVLEKQGKNVFTVAPAGRIRQSLPSQANMQIPFVNAGKPGFLKLFNKPDARQCFERCQQEAATFVENELPFYARTDNMRSLFSVYFFHMTRLHAVCQTNDHKHKRGDPLDNEKDLLNCLCKAPINDLIRVALTSYEKVELFEAACQPSSESDGFELNPDFNAALNRALARAKGGVRVESEKSVEDFTATRNESLYFERNPNEIFLPSSRYQSLGEESEESLGNYGDRVSPENRAYLKEQGWGRRSGWKPEFPLVMTDNPVEPILTEGTAVAVWEQRSRNSPLTQALLPGGTAETGSGRRESVEEVFHQVSHRE